MMRAFFLGALFFTLVYMITDFVFITKVKAERWDALFSDIYNTDYSSDYGSSGYDSYNSYNSYNSYSSFDEAESTSRTGATITLFFLLLFETVFILGLMKVKTKTMKVISIIGLSLTFLVMLVDFLAIANPGDISFDEAGWLFFLFGLPLIAFNVIGTIHAFKTKA
ncbi:MAG TPA: hypothetical protein VL651_12665 [Bacteroidia bacterium]|nr:hypothetical protein [Bacteroidia bacterium]